MYCRLLPFDDDSLLDFLFCEFLTDFTPSLIELTAKSPENSTLTAFNTSLSERVFFLAISVKCITVDEIAFATIQTMLLSCCLELEVIPFFSETCFNTLEMYVSKYRVFFFLFLSDDFSERLTFVFF